MNASYAFEANDFADQAKVVQDIASRLGRQDIEGKDELGPLESEARSLELRARALQSANRLEEALLFITQCAALKPRDVRVLSIRGLLLWMLGRPLEALAVFEMILDLAPDHVDALIKTARIYHHLDHYPKALEIAHRAVAVAPAYPAALNTRGMILESSGCHRAALFDYRQSLTLRPDDPETITQLGMLFAKSGKPREALTCYDRSLSIAPQQPHAVYNRALVRLTLGDWRQGFREFESRGQLASVEGIHLHDRASLWLGQVSIENKAILIHHEQGYGDTLQFVRYVPALCEQGARVLLVVPAPLVSLMKTLDGAVSVLEEGEPTPEYEYHCPAMSLPLAFGTTPGTIPANIPYLTADPEAVHEWRVRLGAQTRMRIGLVWRGRHYPPINHARDMHLKDLVPLLALNADYICLQLDLSSEERATLAAFPNVFCHGEELADFSDTAALIDALDLVITVDTAAAHLAGALGKPVWLMNRYASCWRWLEKRTDSPWYPSMRLFRQPRFGDWTSVAEEVQVAAQAIIREWESAKLHVPAARSPQIDRRRQFAAQFERALSEHHAGRFDRAIDCYQQALALDPGHPDVLHCLGVAFAQQGCFQGAVASIKQSVEGRPDNAAGHHDLGNALAGIHRYDEALQSYERAIALDDRLTSAHYNRGLALEALGRDKAALGAYGKAIELDPNHAMAHSNRGNVLAELGRFAEALAAHRRALTLKADYPQTVANLGVLFARHGNLRAALRCYDHSLSLAPSQPHVLYNRALLILVLGDWKRGFREAESRWMLDPLKGAREPTGAPLWLGQCPIKGRTILIHHEQGYGDTLQFIRYVPTLSKAGARVLLWVSASLRALAETVDGSAQVLTTGDEIPPHDLRCPMMSLPLAFGTTPETVPASVRYLRAHPAKVRSWSRRLGIPSRMRIGLVWCGRRYPPINRARDMTLETLMPLMQVDADFICLQQDLLSEERERLANHPNVVLYGEVFEDFADTAGLIENLDLLITVDTSVAHLAGALGKPVWLMNRYASCWRWLEKRTDSPWYSSMRLFRQQRYGDWNALVEEIRSAAEELILRSRGLPLHGPEERASQTFATETASGLIPLSGCSA